MGWRKREGLDVKMAVAALQNADAVCFDVDSTVVRTEGMDMLASCFGVYREVANLTKLAMGGSMPFQELMQPTREGIERCLKRERPRLTGGIERLVRRLQKRGTDVYLVSGGFDVMVEPVAALLNIPKENIIANTILFDEEGHYRDFDRAAPSSRNDGKQAAVAELKVSHGYNTMVILGDGASDMAARPPADAFIGYGGVEVRPQVQAGADWFVRSWRDVLAIL